MAEVIRMPRMSDTMEEGNIISWLKKVGDEVSPGDVLAEVETDKATMDLESFHEGVLLYIGVEKGPVPVDGIIAVIGEKGEDFQSLLKEEKSEASKAEHSEDGQQQSEPQAQKEKEAVETTAESVPASATGDKIKASPLARKMAKEENIALSGISGTGEGGRIVKRDVEKAMSASPAVATSQASPLPPSGSSMEIELSQMRKTIAKRLSQSKFGAPHFYLTAEIDMDRTVEARKAINAAGDIKISFNDIIIKACALALRKNPMVNGSWMDTKIVLHGDVNIGVAVAVEEGLVVPVIRRADFKSIHEINQEVKMLAGKARDKSIKLDEMQGNTFTISNLGMFGIDEFTAIINPPDSCILAVGSIVQKPVVKNGQVVVGQTMKVTMSCDHRIVDGAKGAQFLQTLRGYLENPLMMLV